MASLQEICTAKLAKDTNTYQKKIEFLMTYAKYSVTLQG